MGEHVDTQHMDDLDAIATAASELALMSAESQIPEEFRAVGGDVIVNDHLPEAPAAKPRQKRRKQMRKILRERRARHDSLRAVYGGRVQTHQVEKFEVFDGKAEARRDNRRPSLLADAVEIANDEHLAQVHLENADEEPREADVAA